MPDPSLPAMETLTSNAAVKPTLGLEAGLDGALHVVIAGAWRFSDRVPASSTAVRAVAERAPSRVVLDATHVSAWDGSLLALAERIGEACAARGIPVDRSGLPAGALRLLEGAERSPDRPAPAAAPRASLLSRMGERTVAAAG